MTEEEILQTVEEHCRETGIYFQVFLQVPYLYIYINREAEHQVDYNQLIEKIVDAIATLRIPDIQGISLHSRILGTVEPDWETYLESDEVPEGITTSSKLEDEPFREQVLSQSESSSELVPVATEHINLDNASVEPEVITPSSELEDEPFREQVFSQNESLSEIVSVATEHNEIDKNFSSEPFDLSKYCFIRNRSLLTASLPHPSANIAKIVDFFHVLPYKQIVVPFLDDIFNTTKTPNTKHHPESIQNWVKEILELDEDKKRKASIWFSRYCINPTATMEQVTAILSETPTPPKTEATELPKTEETEPSLLIAPKYKPPTSAEKQPTQTIATPRLKKAATRKKSPTWQPSSVHLAIASVIFTVFAVIINLRTRSAALETSPLCENSPYPNECELAVQIVGTPAIELATKSYPGIPSQDEGVIADVYTPPYGLSESANGTCAFYGTIKAGMTFKEVSKIIPKPISIEGMIILPGVYVVNVQQHNFKGGSEPVRTACVFHYQENQQKVDVNTLAIEVIPTQWPEESYKTTSQPVVPEDTGSDHVSSP